MNIQQQNALEVVDTETVMADNEGLDPPPPQDISNVFAEADLLSQSSYDTVKYKRAWLRAKGIRSSILSSGESPDGNCTHYGGDQCHFAKNLCQCNYPT